MTINKDLSKTLNTTNDNTSGDLHDGMIPLLLVTLSEKYSAKSPNTQVHSQHLSAKLKVSLVRMNNLLAYLETFGFIRRVTVAANNDVSYSIKLAPSDLPLLVKFGLMGLKKLRQKNQQVASVSMVDMGEPVKPTDGYNVDDISEDDVEDFDIDESNSDGDEMVPSFDETLDALTDGNDKSDLSQFNEDFNNQNDVTDTYEDDNETINDDQLIESDRVTQLNHHDEHYLNDGFESSSFLHWLDSTFYIHRHFQANEQNCQMSSFLKNEDPKLLYDVCLKRNLKIMITDLSKPQLLQFIDMQFQVYQSISPY